MNRAPCRNRAPKTRAWLCAAVLLAAIAPVLLRAAPAQAQEFPRERAFVYGVTNFDGRVYESTLAPPSVNTVYLLADRENVIAPRTTLVYFWPVTNRFLADWNQLNELVEGTLQVSQNGRAVREIALTEYIVQYDMNDAQNTLKMHLGEQARARFAEWEKSQNDYREALAAYYGARQRWDEQVNRLRQQSPSGVVPPGQMPVEPQEPPRPMVLSSSPAQGFVISLAAGTYEIALKRADGSVQADSRKTLVMFNKLRDGITYSVVPQTRWNLPEPSDEPDSIVYALPGSTVYLQAFTAGRYNDLAYARMLDPQDQAARPDRERWVSFDPVSAPRMGLIRGGAVAGEQASRPYFIRQLEGGGLGYEVLPFDQGVMERPTFSGYALELNAAETWVQLLDDRGNPIAGSRRRIVALNNDRVWAPYALSALPLAIGALAVMARRRSARRISVKE